MKTTLMIPEQKTPYFTMQPLTITIDRDLSSLKQTLSKDDFKRFIDIHERSPDNPKKARKEVEQLLTQYPYQPEIMNLLTYLYLARRKVRKADRLIVENYRFNPDYLHAKINYADYCIRKGKKDEISKIFDQKFDLRLLDPKRCVFHLSEYRGLMVLMGFYHLSLKNKDAAEAYFYLAHTVDKSHPSVLLLKKKLYKKSLYKKLFRIDS